MSKHKLLVGLVVLVSIITPVVVAMPAAASTWEEPGFGMWSESNNWSEGIPNSSDAIASFNDIPGAPSSSAVGVDDNYSISELILNNTYSPLVYTLMCNSESSALTIHSAIISNTILATSIQCPIILRNNINLSGTGAGLAVSSVISGPGGLTINANPDFRLYTTAPASYSGPTYINNGKVQAGFDNTFSPNSDYILADSPNAELQNGGPVTQTIGSLSGGAASVVDLWGGTLTVGNQKETTFAGTITDGIGGPSNLIKQGTGKLTLSGTNSYTGTTTVNHGTLVVNGSLASNEVIVAAGAALHGSGTLPAVVLHGIVAPGNSIGTLSGTDFTFASGSTLENEFNSDGQTDLVEASDSVTINPDTTLKLIPDAGTYTQGQTFTILRAPSITGNFSSVIDTSGNLNYRLHYYTDHVDFVITDSSTVPAANDSNETLASTGINLLLARVLSVIFISASMIYIIFSTRRRLLAKRR